MKAKKHIGICMDHVSAHLIELKDISETKIITSKFNHEEKELTLKNSEKSMHEKENHEALSYYKEIGKSILNYDDILLFGPTEAKTELFNLLRLDHQFDNIKIEIWSTDKMTEKQEYAFVKAYFSNS